jgi:dihydrofolate reductase
MRRVVAVEYVSLDGVMEAPAWTEPFFNEEVAKFQYDQLFRSDALLLGRVTYEGFAASWPNMEETEGEFAVRMNTLPKHVATTTLQSLDYARRIEGDVPTAVTRLKRQPGDDILIYGSGELVRTLARANLIDEYRLMVNPGHRWEGKASVRRRQRRSRAEAHRHGDNQHRSCRARLRSGALSSAQPRQAGEGRCQSIS